MRGSAAIRSGSGARPYSRERSSTCAEGRSVKCSVEGEREGLSRYARRDGAATPVVVVASAAEEGEEADGEANRGGAVGKSS